MLRRDPWIVRWLSEIVMGRHAEDSGNLFDLRRSVRLAGLAGGLAWVLAYFLDDDESVTRVVLWVGAILLTVALFGLGLLLVRSDVLALRVFVALALPTLVWGVFGIVHQSAAEPRLVDAAFGAIVGVVSGLRLGHHHAGLPRATL
jgi:hypothetical protein